uniref:Uncharacterized protein n=1 Tax=Micrurus lemniscatus lemniscatus TaxID=129467 RepID=A0A2D4IEG7_MICLE
MIILEIKMPPAHLNSKTGEKARFPGHFYIGKQGKDHSNFQSKAVTEKIWVTATLFKRWDAGHAKSNLTRWAETVKHGFLKITIMCCKNQGFVGNNQHFELHL